MLATRLTAITASAVIACGTSEDLDELDELDELEELNGGKADGAEWASIGHGVVYQQVNAGSAVLLAYGGFSARLAHAAAWASELVEAKLGAADVGHVYAIKGPAQPSYAGREIGNSKLRAHLAELGTDTPIYVVAHSSGSFVAHELLAQLHARGETTTLARIFYANLDGGGSGLTQTIGDELAGLAFVYARDPTLARGFSQNSGAAMSLALAHDAPAFEVSVPNTGCASGAGWCLHDVVITHRPHDPQSFDLARDYTDFANRPVTTEYLELFVSE